VQAAVVPMDPATSSRQFLVMSNADVTSAAPVRSIAKAEIMAAKAKMQARIIGSSGELSASTIPHHRHDRLVPVEVRADIRVALAEATQKKTALRRAT
jgi:hypothetical protein